MELLLTLFLQAVVAIFCLLLFVKTLDPAENEADGEGAADPDRRSTLDRILHKYRRSRVAAAAAAAETANRRPLPSKELIMAMAQRRVYKLKDAEQAAGTDGGAGDADDDDDDDDAGRWATEFVAASCAKLDAIQPNAVALETVVHEFCDRVNKVLDVEQVCLREINETLSSVTVARVALEEEVFKAAGCDNTGAPQPLPRDGDAPRTGSDGCRSRRPAEPYPSSRCLVPAEGAGAADEEDAMFAVYRQLVDDLENAKAAHADRRHVVCNSAAQAVGDPDDSDGTSSDGGSEDGGAEPAE